MPSICSCFARGTTSPLTLSSLARTRVVLVDIVLDRRARTRRADQIVLKGGCTRALRIVAATPTALSADCSLDRPQRRAQRASCAPARQPSRAHRCVLLAPLHLPCTAAAHRPARRIPCASACQDESGDGRTVSDGTCDAARRPRGCGCGQRRRLKVGRRAPGRRTVHVLPSHTAPAAPCSRAFPLFCTRVSPMGNTQQAACNRASSPDF